MPLPFSKATVNVSGSSVGLVGVKLRCASSPGQIVMVWVREMVGASFTVSRTLSTMLSVHPVLRMITLYQPSAAPLGMKMEGEDTLSINSLEGLYHSYFRIEAISRACAEMVEPSQVSITVSPLSNQIF